MKTIQITVDEGLLAKLDADEETKRDGRSAVFRRAVAEYLKHRKRLAIASSYRRGYGSKPGLGAEFDGWENEGEWPND
jgi:metal-responsive CopG/Arc/MetJ family transcriptional regulator